MANILADYLANKLNRAIFNQETFTGPSTIYFALFTVAPTSGGGGTEVSGNNYARVGVVPSGFTFLSNGTIVRNLSAVQFSTPTPSGWGTVVALGAYDAATGGNLLFAETFAGVSVGLGQAPRVEASAGSFSLVAAP